MDIKYQINMQMNYFLTLEKPVNINSADICVFYINMATVPARVL